MHITDKSLNLEVDVSSSHAVSFPCCNLMLQKGFNDFDENQRWLFKDKAKFYLLNV